MLFNLLLIMYLVDSKLIKNIDLPSCRNCKHFKPQYYNDYTSTLNRCEYFGKKDIISDETIYEFVDSCRQDENKCGIEGKYFEEEENVGLKILSHDLKQKSPYILAVLLTIFSSIMSAFLKTK